MASDHRAARDEARDGAAVRRHQRSKPWLIPFIGVMVASGAARLVVLAATSYVRLGDSYDYMTLAHLIGHGNVAAGQGMRTPGYSLFILAQGVHPSIIRIAQAVLGLAITAGVFWIIWRLVHNVWLASTGALLYGLDIAQMRLESAIMTETLATALLLGVAVALVSYKVSPRRQPWVLVALGLAAGLLPLVRPLYVFVPLVCILPVAAMVGLRSRRFWLYLLPAILPLAAWSGYLYATFDYVGLQTDAALGWEHHAAPYIKDAPPRYTVIRTIIERDSSQGELTRQAWEDIQKATGWNFPELSKNVQSMSLGLLTSHPIGYGKQIASAFVNFWKGERPQAAQTWRPLGAATKPVWSLSRYLWVVVSLCFLVVVLGMLASSLHLVRLPRLPWPTFWLTLIVMLSAILQGVTEYGDAMRFGMPTEPYVSVVVMVALGSWLLRTRPSALLSTASKNDVEAA